VLEHLVCKISTLVCVPSSPHPCILTTAERVSMSVTAANASCERRITTSPEEASTLRVYGLNRTLKPSLAR
jgi:hypothetical protein